MSTPPVPSANDPLVQFSVHSLPAADTVLARRTRLGRWKMLFVWAVCAAPVVASYVMYYGVRPEGRTNYGSLIQPAKALPGAQALPLSRLDGQVVSPERLKQQWLLVVVAPSSCDAACERGLYLQRQVREMMGRDKDRIDRVWLVTDQAPLAPALRAGLQGATVLRTDPSALAAWLAPEPGRTLGEHIYLVDPRGDWMMRWPAQPDPARMKKDLLRLLKASEAWDEAGRQGG